ncbi:MAG: hypothetical protein HN804_04615 [Oceanospirillaceae bacterium]|jgi:hypothetical protein|nr:hypothetical protein [Oceanospirillaceae bacterium]|tara:strand:- start:59 stop:499 length:441 start_codon:yes stop_codon:yes gene_type:complete
MAITQAMSTLFKKDVLLGDHHLDSDNIYIALYTSSATLSAATDGYITSNEVANGNGYTTGGNALASKAVTENSTSGVFDAADPEWTSATFTARGALIYNKSLGDTTSNARGAIAILDFGGDFSVAGGTFKIIFPAATASNAIIRID